MPTPAAERRRRPRPHRLPRRPSIDPAAWELAWSDEFDGPAGTPPDPATWGYDLGDGSAVGLQGWGNQERQSYTDSPANASTDGEGNLLITVLPADGSQACWYGPCEHTSARLATKGRFEIQYGRLEARIKVPGDFGLWPAFWMLGANIGTTRWPSQWRDRRDGVRGPAADESSRARSTVPGYSGSSNFGGQRRPRQAGRGRLPRVRHRVEPGRIAWYVDGVEVPRGDPRRRRSQRLGLRPAVLHDAQRGRRREPGGPVAPSTVFPNPMAVDYVRLYKAAAP